MFYPQNGDRIVAIVSVTSLHPMNSARTPERNRFRDAWPREVVDCEFYIIEVVVGEVERCCAII